MRPFERAPRFLVQACVCGSDCPGCAASYEGPAKFKISTKINILESLLEKVDWLFVGGGIANTLHKSKGYEIGQSIVENDFLEEAKDLSKKDEYI